MKPGRDRAGQVWALSDSDDTVYLVVRSLKTADDVDWHDVVVLTTDESKHNWKPGALLTGWLERHDEGKGWGEGDSKRRRIA